VLDFGLAKLAQPDAAGKHASATLSPTITSPALMTGAGVLLGTAAYMSPEQARGREADKRSDIWAFGCVLYEMFSGTRAFAGDEVSDTLASVLAREPDWGRLPPDVPRSSASSCGGACTRIAGIASATSTTFGWVVVGVKSRPSFSWGNPVSAIAANLPTVELTANRSYDITPDGAAFIVVAIDADTQSGAVNLQELHVVVNWTEELRRLAP
jgi:serine/threonine protein kinase